MKYLLAQALNRRFVQSFRQGAADPRRAYAALEQEILGLISKGSFWPQLMGGKSAFRSIEDFPISDYETYRPSIEANFHAKFSPFTGEEIGFWCLSSGTSAEPKPFPITRSYQQQLLRVSGAYTYHLAGRLKFAMNKPLVFFPAAASGRFTDAGAEVGYISRYMYIKQPKPIRNGYAIPEAVVEKFEFAQRWNCLFGAGKDLCAIMAIVPPVISTFCDAIENRKEELFNILAGSTAWPSEISKFKVSKHRLRVMERAFRESPFLMKDLWPSMGAIISWKGSTAGLQVPRVEVYNRGKIFYSDGLYSATEGWMTVPLFQNEDPGAPLHCGATFVEFIREGEPIEAGNLLKPWELEPGEKYEVFLSQAMGFVRYRLYDVVICKGFHQHTPILEFSAKAGNVVALGQVRFSETNLMLAIQRAGFDHPYEWTIAPAADGSGMIFYTSRLTPKLAEQVAKIDAELEHMNMTIKMDYARNLLSRMRVRELPEEHKFWVAGRHAQAKLRVLTKVPLE